MARNLVMVERTAECRKCGGTIAFLKSKRTGRFYPVEVLKDSSDGNLYASPFGFHKCSAAAVEKHQPATEHASREEQHGRYLDCGPQAWDDR